MTKFPNSALVAAVSERNFRIFRLSSACLNWDSPSAGSLVLGEPEAGSVGGNPRKCAQVIASASR